MIILVVGCNTNGNDLNEIFEGIGKMDKYYLLYVLNSLEEEIKSFEEERLDNDTTNIRKLQPLYDLYRKNQNILEKMN